MGINIRKHGFFSSKTKMTGGVGWCALLGQLAPTECSDIKQLDVFSGNYHLIRLFADAKGKPFPHTLGMLPIHPFFCVGMGLDWLSTGSRLSISQSLHLKLKKKAASTEGNVILQSCHIPKVWHGTLRHLRRAS